METLALTLWFIFSLSNYIDFSLEEFLDSCDALEFMDYLDSYLTDEGRLLVLTLTFYLLSDFSICFIYFAYGGVLTWGCSSSNILFILFIICRGGLFFPGNGGSLKALTYILYRFLYLKLNYKNQEKIK